MKISVFLAYRILLYYISRNKFEMERISAAEYGWFWLKKRQNQAKNRKSQQCEIGNFGK
jgi:hypothetical protein